VSQCTLNFPCAGVAVFGHLVNTASSNCDKRKLSRDEKGVETDQKQNDTKAGQYRTGAKVFGRTLLQGQEIHIP
jgi:hypothetical protein